MNVDALAVHSEFIRRSTWGMPAGYSFGSVPSAGWKNSTKVVRDTCAGALPLATRFFGFSEDPRILARESCSCSGVIGLIVMEAYRTYDSFLLRAGVLDR